MENKSKNNRQYYLKKYGKNSISFLTLSDELSVFRKNWDGYIAYFDLFNTSIVIGDPIVPDSCLRQAVIDFKEYIISKNKQICFLLCTDQVKDTLEKEKFIGMNIGEEAIVDITRFSLSGNKKWNIRSSINYANKKGMFVEEYKQGLKKDEYIENEILRISREWCKLKKIPKPRLVIGQSIFDNDIRYFVCKYKDEIVGYVNYYPIYCKKNYYLDHTRKSIISPRGTIDFLMIESFKKLISEGIQRIHIGLAPFCNIDKVNDDHEKNYLMKISKLFFNFFYPTKGEFYFKSKYATSWNPNYLFCYPGINIRLLFSLANSFYTGGLPALLYTKIKYSVFDR